MAFYKSELFKSITGKNPVVLVDIGARGGLSPRWQPLRDSLRVIGFEPDEAECLRLNAAGGSRRTCYPVALAGKKEKRTLYLTRDRDCASIIEPDIELLRRFQSAGDFELTGKAEIPCDTLDNVVADNKIPAIDFIKIDSQGSELEILRGAEQTLARSGAFGVEVEVEFSPLYQEQPLFADVDAFLRDRGFSLFDIRTPPGRKIRKTVPAGSREWAGQALWTDAVYLRDLAAADNRHAENLNQEAAFKTLAIAELYGFGDFALELLELFSNLKITSAEESAAVRAMLLAGVNEGFKPEEKLFQNLKNAAAEYAQRRVPSLYKLITNRPEPK